MSIQKHLNSRPYLKHINQNPTFQYRVRNLSKNQSMKHLTINNSSKRDVLAKINNKYTIDTSFFSKQNVDLLQVQSQQDLPKYSVENHKRDQQRPLRRNASHRVLRKVNSCQLLPQSIESIPSEASLKKTFMKNDFRKFSLKKKVQFIKKKHDQNKSQILQQQITQIQSQNFLGQKKKSKPKLKLLVRDPFHSSKSIHQRKKVQFFGQSRIEPVNDTSMVSETSRQQFQNFLSCMH